MSIQTDDNLNDKLLQAKNRLSKLSDKLKKYVDYNKDTVDATKLHTSRPTSLSSKTSLSDIHNKLRKINSYLKSQVEGDRSAPPPSYDIPEEPIEESPNEVEIDLPDETAGSGIIEPAEIEIAQPVIEPEDQPEPERSARATPPKPHIDPYAPKVTHMASPVPGVKTPRKSSKSKKAPVDQLGVGLDLGTSYINAAREVGGASVFIKSERNAFLAVRCDQVTKELLTKLKLKYCINGEEMYVLGHSALDLATIFNREAQRTMSYGILNPREERSIPMIKLLVQNILWSPREQGEICCFSVPAPPVDKDQDTVYHRGVFEGLLRSLGFEPTIIDEGYAVVLSELAYQDFTGIGISCGGGLVNICAAFKSVPIISFSISRGGDWIDKSVASALGIASATATSIKEHGMNIKSPAGRDEEAVSIYYRNYISYLLQTMFDVFSKSANAPQFKDPVDIVFAGGSSMVGGFLDVVKEEIKNMSPSFSLGNVRRAEEPFTSVSRGCLFSAINASLSKKR